MTPIEGLKECSSYACLFVKRKENSIAIMLVSQIKIKDMAELKYFLGLEMQKIDEGIHISQRKYILDFLEDMKLK